MYCNPCHLSYFFKYILYPDTSDGIWNSFQENNWWFVYWCSLSSDWFTWFFIFSFDPLRIFLLICISVKRAIISIYEKFWWLIWWFFILVIVYYHFNLILICFYVFLSIPAYHIAEFLFHRWTKKYNYEIYFIENTVIGNMCGCMII